MAIRRPLAASFVLTRRLTPLLRAFTLSRSECSRALTRARHCAQRRQRPQHPRAPSSRKHGPRGSPPWRAAIAPSVGALPSRFRVIRSVHLNDDPAGRSIEVDDARLELHDLPAKPYAELPARSRAQSTCSAALPPGSRIAAARPEPRASDEATECEMISCESLLVARGQTKPTRAHAAQPQIEQVVTDRLCAAGGVRPHGKAGHAPPGGAPATSTSWSP